ncbi:hypothetical protein [uncultured Streptomyces sp.]|uniref:hypothetical protein n=1 Tax=uncultured Streptomyces sp. TaxID=174707 RepID=UPI00260F5992|nr:hypothetical protein [uncultured Streptomyces sp.]
MIASTVRYVVLAVAAVAALTAGIHYLTGHQAPEAVLCLLLTLLCMSYGSYVRRTAEDLQELHADARRAADANRWPAWCCESGFLSGGRAHHDCADAVRR